MSAVAGAAALLLQEPAGHQPSQYESQEDDSEKDSDVSSDADDSEDDEASE